MAWVTPPTFVSGNVLTAAQLTILGNDLLETAVAKATTSGQYFVTTAANTLAARTPIADAVDVAQTTTSASFTDLATVGPTVTTTTGARALVMIASDASNNTALSFAYMSYAVTGASSIAASLNRSVSVRSAVGGAGGRASAIYLEQSLVPGSNVFTAKYLCGSGGTASYNYRTLVVMGF